MGLAGPTFRLVGAHHIQEKYNRVQAAVRNVNGQDPVYDLFSGFHDSRIWHLVAPQKGVRPPQVLAANRAIRFEGP